MKPFVLIGEWTRHIYFEADTLARLNRWLCETFPESKRKPGETLLPEPMVKMKRIAEGFEDV